MKKYLLSILILFFACASTKDKVYKENAKKEFTGVINKSILLNSLYKEWFKERYEIFELKDSLRKSMKESFKDVKVKAFVGLWCGDSKREIPSLLKMLNEVQFDETNIEIIAVNHKKKANGLEKGNNIFRVPTFIFYKNNKEIGRFVEFPQETLEQDILKIISGKPYKHFYQE